MQHAEPHVEQEMHQQRNRQHVVPHVEQVMHQQRSRQHAAQLAEHLTSKKEMCQVFYENLTCSVSPCRGQLQMG